MWEWYFVNQRWEPVQSYFCSKPCSKYLSKVSLGEPTMLTFNRYHQIEGECMYLQMQVFFSARGTYNGPVAFPCISKGINKCLK